MTQQMKTPFDYSVWSFNLTKAAAATGLELSPYLPSLNSSFFFGQTPTLLFFFFGQTPTLLETRLLILEGAPYGKLLNKPIKYASQLVSIYN